MATFVFCSGFYPDYAVTPGGYEVTAISPAFGPESNKGTGATFTLQFPYIWVPAPFGSCVLPLATDTCGIGVATRQVRCE